MVYDGDGVCVCDDAGAMICGDDGGDDGEPCDFFDDVRCCDDGRGGASTSWTFCCSTTFY